MDLFNLVNFKSSVPIGSCPTLQINNNKCKLEALAVSACLIKIP
jgi:hypothetical protein